MATQQISLRLNKGLYLTALLLAAQAETTVTEVITKAMQGALEGAFQGVPDAAKGHLAEMASRKEVDMVDARVSIRLANAGVPATFEVGTLFHDVDEEEAEASDTKPDDGKPKGDSAKGKKK